MKNKGFTLIELLAMLVVMGILIGIAIPNISGIVGKQKENAFKSDVNNLVERVKIKVAKDSRIGKPNVGECFIFTLDYLNDEEEYQKGPSDGDYEQFDSFIVFTAAQTPTGAKKYKYYVRLIEKVGNNYYGLDLKDIDTLTDYKEEKVNTFYNLTKDKSTISNLGGLPSICNSITNYYVHRKI